MQLAKKISTGWYVATIMVISMCALAFYMDHRPTGYSYMNGHISSDKRQQTISLTSAELWDAHLSVDPDNFPHVVGMIQNTSKHYIQVAEITFIDANQETFDLQPNLTLKPGQAVPFVTDPGENAKQRSLIGEDFTIAYKVIK